MRVLVTGGGGMLVTESGLAEDHPLAVVVDAHVVTHVEMAVLVDEQLPVKLAIFNNAYLGMIRQWQQLFYGKNYSSSAISQPDILARPMPKAFSPIIITSSPGRICSSASMTPGASNEPLGRKSPMVTM